MNQEIKTRKNLRLKNYDYRQSGFYFVTICVKDRENHFGEVANEKVRLSELGNIVKKCWFEIPEHFQKVRLDEFIVMPNHLHGIIEIIRDFSSVGGEDIRPLRKRDKYGKRWYGAQSGSLSSLIRSFKIGVSKWCKENDYNGLIWQRSFYDKIIRDEVRLNNVREYIQRNPQNWENDFENKELYDQLKPELRRIKLKMHYDDLIKG